MKQTMQPESKMNSEIRHAEELLRRSIREGLDSLSEEEKRDRGLLPFVPTIPATEQKQRDFIEDFTNPFECDDYTEEDLRAELLHRLKNSGLNINSELPADQLQAAMKEKIATMSPEELLQVGVFGQPFTQEDAEEARSWNEEFMFLKKVKSN
ncbi:MAG: hypothetical protein WKF97_19535 [Chitinophagaceae bacterium]